MTKTLAVQVGKQLPFGIQSYSLVATDGEVFPCWPLYQSSASLIFSSSYITFGLWPKFSCWELLGLGHLVAEKCVPLQRSGSFCLTFQHT